ncbi:MAG: hypothetical protein ABR899_09880, partial [Candidatus Krumholzibacteriaceae bacterium]
MTRLLTRNEIITALALLLAAVAGCDNTAPGEKTVSSCEENPAVMPAATRYIYMSPAGNDENSGSEAAPVATLNGVQDILRDERPDSSVVVRIRSDAGVYYGQSVIWDYFNPDRGITFEAWPDSVRASFRQGGADTVFFVLKASAGRATHVHFRRFFVQGYRAGAIWFTGEAGDESGWNGSNSITDCVMEDIGNAAQPERQISWSVIDLVNSRHNVIRDCSFIDCANANTNAFPQKTGAQSLTAGPNQPIIGVYLAHHSSCNQITGCIFRRFKGDAVRIRDDSNGNEISYCYFQQTGWTAVCTMWYQYPQPFSLAGGECPSWDNLFHHNRAEGNWLCGESLLFWDMSTEQGLRCPQPA